MMDDPDEPSRTQTAAPRALALAAAAAVTFYAVAGLSEAVLVRVLKPTESELDWISDAVLSIALGVAMYLWLRLRATRRALTERERAQVVIQAQLSMAEAMQRRLLPPVPAPVNGFEWAAMLTPAGKIGGDFFDFLEPAPGVCLMLIADVSGKGISAAMALTLLRAAFRNIAHDTRSPAELASRMSAAFDEEWHGSPYVTGVIARIDAASRRLTYTNAGHPPGIVIRDGGDRSLGEGGPPLGLVKGAQYPEESVDLEAGDICAFVTDGITESFDESQRPWRTVARDAVRTGVVSAETICKTIMARAQAGHGPDGVHDWTDDRTVIVLAVDDVARPPSSPR
jgi:sigma-B regulation protein RsbU (phosphoserine phosphatase)